ncbi:hypothetical protein Tco_0379707 [Tanacetum coccineum]
MGEGTTKVLACNTYWMWQLSGLPCVHATKVIFLINKVPKSYVPAWFETDMYFVAYHNYVKPVLGMNFWPDQSMYSTVLPPKPRKIPGRPRKKRIRAIGVGDSSTRVSKRGLVRDEGASRTRGGAIGSRGRGGRGGASGSRGGASGSIGRGADGSDEPEQTQAEPQQTQHEPEQTQVEDQVEQTEDQAEIDLTQLEQTQEPTQDQVHPQEQP